MHQDAIAIGSERTITIAGHIRNLRPLFALSALLTACGAVDSPAVAPSRSPLADFLIQNVCLDEAGRVTSQDPASCTRSRNLRLGETPPYFLTDLDAAQDGKRYQAISSVPLPNSQVKIEKRMGEGTIASFDLARGGYDVIEQQGEYVSFVKTYDQQCGEQHLSGAGEGDGWLLFPNRAQIRAGSRRQDMTLTRSEVLPTCPTSERVSRVTRKQIAARWTAPHPFKFESGKVLTTIMSEHHAHHDLSRRNNAIETFYFTREYGLSRWEASIPEQRCLQERPKSDPLRMCYPDDPANFLRGRCQPGEARAIRGGQQWIRVDCRDTTFHLPKD